MECKLKDYQIEQKKTQIENLKLIDQFYAMQIRRLPS
jgi:hypothetical protein